MNNKKLNKEIVEGTFGRLQQVNDFLPKPEDLVLKTDDTVKITMQLKRSSVNFFKQEAKRLGSSYQTMIRNLLDQYTNKHQSK